MAGSGGIPVLAPSERLLYKARLRYVDVAVTNLRLIVAEGIELRDVLLEHIYSVQLSYRLGLVAAGIILLLIDLLAALYMVPALVRAVVVRETYIGPGGADGLDLLVKFVYAVLLAVAGVAVLVAVYGWLNRYRLTVYHPGGRIVLQGGEPAYRLMIELREALLKRGPRLYSY